MSLTVACVWVKGNVDYGVEYVSRLKAMCARHLVTPFRFVCFTDRPDVVSAIGDAVPIHLPRGMFGWWSKVEMFNPQHGLKGRVVYLDLDTLVVDDLGPIVHFPADFALVPHAGTFNGKNGLAVVKRFNSSVMVWDAGTKDHIYENWTPSVTKRLHGDQDWIGETCPDAAAMPLAWFPRLSELGGEPPKVPPAKVVLAKKPKNFEAAKRFQWVNEAWG